MGLNIAVYSNIKFIKEFKDHSELVDDDYDNGIVISTDQYEPGRLDGLRQGVYQSEGAEESFRAGSYGGYNEWRAQLCEMAHHIRPEVMWDDVESFKARRSLN